MTRSSTEVPLLLSAATRSRCALGMLVWLVMSLLLAARAALPAAPLRGNLGIHDPSTIIKCKDRYYIIGTGQGIITKWSADKVFWTAGPTIFTNPPAWTTNALPGFTGYFWAPDIFFLNGRYCVYYAVSSWGGQVSAIGLVTNPTLDPSDPAYQWTDQGVVIQSGNGSPFNTIDPSVTRDAAGNPWMSFGSYWNGIYVVQLDPLTGLRLAPNSPTTRVAYNSSIEASCLYRRGGYYYLFVNWGSCCVGVNSTYNVRVGRSTSVTGPYLDRKGVDLASNGGTLFLEGTGKFTGPGHMGILAENGVEAFSYHYYDAGAWAPWYSAFGPADFDLEPLSWTADDWPLFTNDWSAVYNFQADARDENGQYYGLLLGGASVTNDPVRGHVLNLSGTNQFVQLPPGVAYARTFSAVVKWNGGGAWQRIFDFGTDTSRYVMLTPSSGSGRLQLDIKAGGGVQSLIGPSGLPVGVWTHVAVTLDGSRGVLYVNGLPVATNSSLPLSPLDVLAQTNHLGHSKFVADPDFKGQIASFRAYGRVLSPAEIAAPLPVIAQPADGSTCWPGSTISFSGSATDFADASLAVSALSWRVEYRQDGLTNVVFGPVAGIANGVFMVPTNAPGGGSYRLLLTATDGGGRTGTAAATLLPANAPSAWSSYYPLRGDASDANGHFNGALNGGASIQNDAARGDVLNLSGASQFASLPAAASRWQTFMVWVKWNGGASWQRIFDFGNDTTHYCVLTPSAANGRLRCNITVNGTAGEQIMDAPGPLPVGVWTHVAVVLDGNTGVLYTNGVSVATNAALNLQPTDLGATNNWFGRSQWPDPYLNGRLSAVRLFSRALSASEIMGPQPVVTQPGQGMLYRPGDTVTFSGGATDFYDATLAATSLAWSVQWYLSGTPMAVLGPTSGLTNGVFTIPTTGSAASNGFYRITLIATDSASHKATNSVDIFPVASAVAADWASFYPFAAGAQDASNRYHGTLSGGASIQSDAARGNVLNLAGSSQYVNLPSGVGSLRTFSGWVRWNGGADWQRILDFGQDTHHWLYLTPRTSSGRLQCAITPDDASFVQFIEATNALPIGVWTHVAFVLDGRQGILYVNGQPVAVNNSVNLLPSDVAATKTYFGRSQFPADAYFNGRLDSLRLNSQALPLADITAPTPRITLPVSGALYTGGQAVLYAGSGTDYADAALPPSALTWSAEFRHDGVVDSAFGPLTGVTGGAFLVPTNGPTSTNVFYRINLLVTDAMGNQRAATTDVQPRTSWLNFATVPAGLQVALDGLALSAPTSVVAVAGMVRSLSVPIPQNSSGSNYNFVLWSDNGALTHSIVVATNDSSYTASFQQPTLQITGMGANLRLSWPGWAGALTLAGASNLVPPVFWGVVTNSALTANGLQILTLPSSNGNQFYRLQSP